MMIETKQLTATGSTLIYAIVYQVLGVVMVKISCLKSLLMAVLSFTLDVHKDDLDRYSFILQIFR